MEWFCRDSKRWNDAIERQWTGGVSLRNFVLSVFVLTEKNVRTHKGSLTAILLLIPSSPPGRTLPSSQLLVRTVTIACCELLLWIIGAHLWTFAVVRFVLLRAWVCGVNKCRDFSHIFGLYLLTQGLEYTGLPQILMDFLAPNAVSIGQWVTSSERPLPSGRFYCIY